jgi:cold shock CspA family protein
MKPVKQKGQLKTWKDDRGFGFIKPDDDSKEVFLHISALKGMARRPIAGDIILYELTTETDGKVRASNASIQGVAPGSLPKKNNAKKQGVLETVLGISSIMVVIAIFAGQFSSSRSPSAITSISPITSITKPGCNIKGNISFETGKKLYHLPGMEDYESTRINPEKGERWFCTESEASANGWRKAPR